MSGLLGALPTVLVGYFAARYKFRGEMGKASSSNEGVYAENTQQLFDRIDRLMSQRDSLVEEVAELRSENQQLSRKIDKLSHKIDQLNGVG